MGIIDFLRNSPLNLSRNEPTDVPTVYGKQYERRTASDNERFNSIYKFAIFDSNFNADNYTRSRMEAIMQNPKDHAPNAEWYNARQYVHKLYSVSNKIKNGDIKRPQKYFELLDEMEELFPQYQYHRKELIKFYYDAEYKRYYQYLPQCTKRFLSNSFKHEFRASLELKTEKGRIDRIDHWFKLMDYYTPYMDAYSLDYYEQLKDKWNNSFLDIKID